MRKRIAAAALLIWQALPAHAQDVQTGRILSVDDVSMSFTVQSGTAIRQYWATRATRIRSNHPNAFLFDLASGRRVTVISHRSGDLDIADMVTY